MRRVCVGVFVVLLVCGCSSTTPSPSPQITAPLPLPSSSAVASTNSVEVSPPEDTSPANGGFAHYSGRELSFDYPASWNQASFEEQSSFSRTITFLSTDALSQPCTTRVVSAGTETDCDSPIGADGLGTDGVLVTWFGRAFPGWSFDAQGGTLGQIGDLTATMQDEQAGELCDGVKGALREMVAIIPRPDAQSNWYEMDACYTGPDVSLVRSQLQAMLGSVQWTTSP